MIPSSDYIALSIVTPELSKYTIYRFHSLLCVDWVDLIYIFNLVLV